MSSRIGGELVAVQSGVLSVASAEGGDFQCLPAVLALARCHARGASIHNLKKFRATDFMGVQFSRVTVRVAHLDSDGRYMEPGEMVLWVGCDRVASDIAGGGSAMDLDGNVHGLEV